MAPLPGMIRYNTDTLIFERSVNEGTSWSPLIISGITVTPAGSDTEIQINDGGVFGTSTAFRFDITTDFLYIGGDIIFDVSIGFRAGTADGSDNKILTFSGGGLDDADRGAFIRIGGNESSLGGSFQVGIGTASGAKFSILDSADNEAISVDSNVNIVNNLGVGGNAASKRLGLYYSGSENIEIFEMLAASLASGNLIYGWIGRETDTGKAGAIGFQYESTTDNSFLFLVNLGDNHITSGFILRKGGNVGIGVLPTAQLHTTGTVIHSGLGARVVGDRYVIVDASGNLHKSAVGPTS